MITAHTLPCFTESANASSASGITLITLTWPGWPGHWDGMGSRNSIIVPSDTLRLPFSAPSMYLTTWTNVLPNCKPEPVEFLTGKSSHPSLFCRTSHGWLSSFDHLSLSWQPSCPGILCLCCATDHILFSQISIVLQQFFWYVSHNDIRSFYPPGQWLKTLLKLWCFDPCWLRYSPNIEKYAKIFEICNILQNMHMLENMPPEEYVRRILFSTWNGFRDISAENIRCPTVYLFLCQKKKRRGALCCRLCHH